MVHRVRGHLQSEAACGNCGEPHSLARDVKDRQIWLACLDNMPAVSIQTHAQVDFGYFGPPEEHLLWTEEEREATYITPEDPSSEIAGEVAAAFAATAIAFNETGVTATAYSI